MNAKEQRGEPEAAASGASGEEVSFEASLQRLETIVRQLEDGALGLTDSLARYEEGLRCLQQCHALLQQAERKVELMTGVAADGTPVVQAFDEGELSLEEKAASRSKRRSRADAKSEPKGEKGDLGEEGGGGASGGGTGGIRRLF
ncbi:MAG: exodeoxyribonuclease VII small subunit [Pirellulales bacterium]